MKIVVVDPPTSKVTLFATPFNKVSHFCHKNDEEISVFISRFLSAAAENLEHSNSSPSSNIGQVLAITLLKPPNLDESTIAQCNLSLISLADIRAKASSSTKTFSVNEVDL